MELGTAFHDACEDPVKYEETYVILPADCRPGSGAGMKERKKVFLYNCEVGGKKIIKQEDYDTLKGMAASIHADPYCQDLLEGKCETELSGYWEDPETGLLCKCRLDVWNKSKNIIIDYKSTVDARPYPFYASARREGYGFQAAFYLYGVTQITQISHRDFYMIACEKTPPYGVQVHPVLSETIEYWLGKLGGMIDKYIQCEESGIWPCYEAQPPGLGLAPWEKKELELDNF